MNTEAVMTDWNEKLALFLLGLSATARAHDPAREGEGRLPAGLLEPEREKDLRTRFEQAWSWIDAACDRPPLPAPTADKSPRVAWLDAPEFTHPLSAARRSLDARLPSERVQGAISSALDEIASRSAGDSKRHALWLWRRLAERLSELDGSLGADWFRYPADPRAPHLTAWQQIAATAALASAGSEPALLCVGVELSLEAGGRNPHDAGAASSIRSLLAWVAARTLAEQLGPDAILMPALSQFPCTDAWLSAAGVPDVRATDGSTWGFPASFLALVPSSRAEELGAACATAIREAWGAMLAPVRDALAGLAGSDAGFAAAWTRQGDAALDAWWTVTPVEEDSTGAGALIASRDIGAYDKIVKQRRDASGAEAPGRGAYLGLWCEAARASGEARRMIGACSGHEPRPRCTCCGDREALGSGGSPLWNAARAKWSDRIGPDELLCAVCAAGRLGPAIATASWPKAPQTAAPSGPLAVLVVSGDGLSAALRPGDSKEAATLRSVLHTEMPALLQKLRSRWRDGLDLPILSGVGRILSASEAVTTWALHTARHEVAAAGGVELSLSGNDLVALVPVSKALGLAARLRETWRTPFATIQGPAGHESRLHPGPVAPLGCAISIAPDNAPLPLVAARCSRLLQRAMQENLGREAFVVEIRRDHGRGWMLAGKWDEIGPGLDALVAQLRSHARREALIAETLQLGVALTDTDLDKPKQEVRVAVLRAAVSGVLAGVETDEAERIARTLLGLVDHNASQALDPDGNHGLDGLRIAAFLAEGNA
ncbi:MAG TPA: type III-B CRISPR-associated protein Cas10/Cmr2 [Polyangiaceae bacterium]|nr:type III-B CRISPR-associated protein Cas10/Cmr2 [Polyangiaceae bacterium]